MLNRRSFLAAAGALQGATRAAPPNIVLILSDDLGSADLSATGADDIRTPNIDEIARQGVRFSQAYSSAPECTPSRAALLTGLYQQRLGGLECAIGVGNVGRYDEAVWLQNRGELGLPAGQPTLASLLRIRGYETACFGKWHLGYGERHAPSAFGFDEFFGVLGGNADYFRHTEEDGTNVLYRNGRPVREEGYLTDLIGSAAARWLDERGRRPFFLYVPFTAPHSPYQSHSQREIPPGMWNKGSRRVYAEMVEAMDRQVGVIVSRLRERGLLETTWLVFLSDNGGTGVGSNRPLRGGKTTLWEGGIRTPCFMRWPGVFRPGSETAQVTLMMDVAAGILAAAGVKAPRLDGLNLMERWQCRKPPLARTVFWRYRRGDVTRKAVRRGDWKVVLDSGREELHNLARDPLESSNIIGSQPAIAADLRLRLARWENGVRAPRLAEFYRRGGV
jgi:N-acetylgalactosamine-6-sulfatase